MPKERKKFPKKVKTEQKAISEAEENKEKAIKRRRSEKEDLAQAELDSWKPKTSIGKKVKSKDIVDIDSILERGEDILEKEIVDMLLPGLDSDLLLVGQSKGKFGGGARRVFRQTQKKTREGNKPKFSTIAVIGNKNGYVGVGYGKSKETVPAREKAIRNAKLNIFKIRRACGSWACGCKEPHTIPFSVVGKCGSVEVQLIPAPKGTGLKIENECAKILSLAGIQDVWSKTLGHSSTKFNLIYACVDALKKLMLVRVKEKDYESLGMIEGEIRKNA